MPGCQFSCELWSQMRTNVPHISVTTGWESGSRCRVTVALSFSSLSFRNSSLWSAAQSLLLREMIYHGQREHLGWLKCRSGALERLDQQRLESRTREYGEGPGRGGGGEGGRWEEGKDDREVRRDEARLRALTSKTSDGWTHLAAAAAAAAAAVGILSTSIGQITSWTTWMRKRNQILLIQGHMRRTRRVRHARGGTHL